jgi:HD-GYP domain-containing protein (c-di-GMP phosphodiesterase class II)
MEPRFAAHPAALALAPAAADADLRAFLHVAPACHGPDAAEPPRTPHGRPGPARGPRLAELLGALSHALDLTGGLQPGHAARSCWIAQQVGHALGLGKTQLRDLYYAVLLKDAGCSSNAARVSALWLGDDRAIKRDIRTIGTGLPALLGFVAGRAGAGAGPARRLQAAWRLVRHREAIAQELAQARCQRGAEVARQLRFGEAVAAGIAGIDERWDGSGHPGGLRGEDIPLIARIALLAQVVEVYHASAGPRAAREEVALRRGGWLDPRLADVFVRLADGNAFWRRLAAEDLEHELFALEPARQPQPVDDDDLDAIALAFGHIVDAKSPFTGGHSARVAELADQLATELGLAPDARRWLRRGALLHDVGKLGVSNAILDKPGKLDPTEWAAVQRHALYTEQILGRITAFGVLARVAGAHHEKLDGTGYPRGLDARHIRLETRIITTADVFDALTARRPYRDAMPVEQALAIMAAEEGTAFDADCLAALRRVLAAPTNTGPGLKT